MRLQIRIAVVGDPARGYFASAERFGEPPYVEPARRLAVHLTVDDETLLVDALREAGGRLGVGSSDARGTAGGGGTSHLPATVSFVTPWVLGGLTWPDVEVPLVDDQGRAYWGTHFHEVRFEQLLRAADAGVLPGDPRQPVLMLESTGGDYAIEWSELINGLKAVWPAIEALGTASGAIGGVAMAGAGLRKLAALRVARRVRRYQEILQARQGDWEARRVARGLQRPRTSTWRLACGQTRCCSWAARE